MSQLFIWNSVEGITSNWHDGGGLVVVAESLEAARDEIERQTERLDGTCTAMTTDPDAVYDVGDAIPRYFLFPDAGCC